MRIAVFGHSAGAGGGDMLLAGIMRQLHGIDWTYVYRSPNVTRAHLERWMRWSGMVPANRIDQIDMGDYADADLVIVSLCPEFDDIRQHFTCPVIEFIQGDIDRDAVMERAKKAHYVVTVSGHLANMAKQSGVTAPVRVIPSAADPSRVTPGMVKDELRTIWHVEENQRILLSLGRVDEFKNTGAIVEALTQLPDEWVGLVVGNGPSLDGLMKDAAKYVPGRLMTATDPWQHPGNFYAAADCLLFASKTEGDPIVVHEAALSGVPMVLSELPVLTGRRQLAGDFGQYIPQGATAAQMATAVLNAVENRDAQRRAFAFTWQNHTLSRVATLWHTAINDIMVDAQNRAIRPHMTRIGGKKDLPAKAGEVEYRRGKPVVPKGKPAAKT